MKFSCIKTRICVCTCICYCISLKRRVVEKKLTKSRASCRPGLRNADTRVVTRAAALSKGSKHLEKRFKGFKIGDTGASGLQVSVETGSVPHPMGL